MTLLLVENVAFAQFKQLTKTAQNMKNLEAAVTRRIVEPAWQVQVPTRFVPGGQVRLSPVSFPYRITPVTVVFMDKILANNHKPLTNIEVLSKVGNRLAREEGMRFVLGEHAVGKAFYEDQSELARDLDQFYEGKADEWVGPDGHVVKFYALPVDGILYKPVGYQVPVVLNPKDYFVIYDVQAHTGKIADNTPQVYDGFLTRTQYEDRQQLQAQTVKSNPAAAARPYYGVSYEYKKGLYAKDRALNRWKQTWYVMGLPCTFASQQQLGQALQVFYDEGLSTKVRLKDQHSVSYIFEIPVRGLIYKDAHGNRHEVNGDEQVFWYLDDRQGSLINRSDFEENNLFEFVE